ncbi:MAG: ATPase [Candidatus Sericytochromatia bacterium]|nr:MAG: ATPase [Candidatus Sericytochromatia bacterium]
MSEIKEKISILSLKFNKLKDELNNIIIGQHELIESLIICLIANGNILIEGVPGLAKTLSIKTLAKFINTDFKRIQFTPDLLPSDLIGSEIFDPKTSEFKIKKGPIFTNILLADEINRAPAKVQTALLEAMQERQITISGVTFNLPELFLVMATQNPIEHEGTYNLPEAQLDRFMLKINISYPNKENEIKILNLSENNFSFNIDRNIINENNIFEAREIIKNIYADDRIKKYIIDLVFATRNPSEYNLKISKYIEYGVSPRASIYLLLCSKVFAFLNKRDFVIPEDIKKVFNRVFNHRIILSYQALSDSVKIQDIIKEILNKVQIY